LLNARSDHKNFESGVDSKNRAPSRDFAFRGSKSVVYPLEEVSPLVTTLNETRRSQWRLGVYAPKGLTDVVSEAARSVLSIKPFTRQERLL